LAPDSIPALEQLFARPQFAVTIQKTDQLQTPFPKFELLVWLRTRVVQPYPETPS